MFMLSRETYKNFYKFRLIRGSFLINFFLISLFDNPWKQQKPFSYVFWSDGLNFQSPWYLVSKEPIH